MLSTTSIRRIACAVAFAGAAAAGSTAFAHPGFSFRDVEFMPDEQQAPAADAFVRRVAAPGAPLAQAVAALRAAGAYCPAARNGVVSCIHSSTVRPLGHDLSDVVWRVNITTANGAVSAATVARTFAGV